MLDPETYRANERLAKSLIPSWRVSQIHNVDHFERSGFPVRLGSIRELGQIIDTMQENRFDLYMAELGGLSPEEYRFFISICEDAVRFQLTYLPHRPPTLPVSTLLSAFALYRKLSGINPGFESLLEIGPGCGYLSFFLNRHGTLHNYSQIEACESFYLLQNLVNVYCFGHRAEERALPPEDVPAVDFFVNQRADTEFSPHVRLPKISPLSVHYPWWRIGEIISRDVKFDIVTSNANLLEFNAPALDDYLTILHRALKPEGMFLVQCTGHAASGTVTELLDKIHEKGFAPLMFVQANMPVRFPGEGNQPTLLGRILDGDRDSVVFTTNNALFVRVGHPLFDTYYQRKNYHMHFVAPEAVVASTFFKRAKVRRFYTVQEILEDTERRFAEPLASEKPSRAAIGG